MSEYLEHGEIRIFWPLPWGETDAKAKAMFLELARRTAEHRGEVLNPGVFESVGPDGRRLLSLSTLRLPAGGKWVHWDQDPSFLYREMRDSKGHRTDVIVGGRYYEAAIRGVEV